MTTLKKSVLALSVMAMPFAATAEMQALEDQAMGSITGQAGVTIELETKVNIDRFIYTDEGSFEINDISIGGANDNNMFPELSSNRDDLGLNATTDMIDSVQIEIDVQSGGDAIILLRPNGGGATPVDFAVTAGEMRLSSSDGSASTLVADNLSIKGVFNRFDMHIDAGVDSQGTRYMGDVGAGILGEGITDELNIHAAIAIDDLDVDLPMLALGIRDMRVTGANYLYGDSKSIGQLAADIKMSLYAGERADGGQALAIDLQEFNADMEIGQLLVGGASIGSIGIDNLKIHETKIRVYGH